MFILKWSVILTEKPSVARDFAAALNIPTKGKYMFKGEGYIIIWAIGHLLELLNPEDYNPLLKKWRQEHLPILPRPMRLKPKKSTAAHLKSIAKVLSQKNIKHVIVATDAGREGELIGRSILSYAGYRGPACRFWTSQALLPPVILKELQALKPLTEYDGLFNAGRARSKADWLVGINLSRFATIKWGDLYSLGRVQTTVLSLIVERELQRNDFVPVDYYQIKAEFSKSSAQEKFNATRFQILSGKKEVNLFDKKKAEEIALKLVQKSEATVSKIICQKKIIPPPKLFSLTELQRTANRKYAFSAKKTLSLAQKLYERDKCISYPRTDARVLGTTSLPLVKKIIASLVKSHDEHIDKILSKKITLKNYRVFDDAALTDHHALIPLKALPANLSKDEYLIFNLIKNRFIAVFCDDFCYNETVVEISCEDEQFSAKGTMITIKGWTEIEGYAKLESVLPGMIKGDKLLMDQVKIKDLKTLPPPEYTEALLLFDMVNPGKYVAEKDLKKIFRGDVGLGTQATRATIIETLINRSYVKRVGRKLLPVEKGMFLIKALKKIPQFGPITSPAETASWEAQLNQIATGEIDEGLFLNRIEQFITSCVHV